MIRGLNSPGGGGLGLPTNNNNPRQSGQQQFYEDEPYQPNASRFSFGGGIGSGKPMEQRRETGNLIPIAQRSMASAGATPFGSAPAQSYFGGNSNPMASPRKIQQTHQMLFGSIQQDVIS
uniref:Uncharacterized protein n=1 Tax=Caenorhabditis tropicalis TaxID=1561998 RepID=A0A1I7T2W0_9PELO